MTDSRPQKLGRYDVLTPLSTGGMAELSLACCSGAGGFRKFVALKRILPQFRNEEEFVAMFLDEARISAALSHANIAQVFDLSDEGNDFFIAMEFIEGQDLSRIHKVSKRQGSLLPVGFVAAVMRDVCNALHYAHHFKSPSGRALPVIHRDLSLRNVMVAYSGTTKIIDFGIAKARGGLSTTKAGIVKGSSGYMSPEQIRGEELEGTSDLFAAGAVLYELLTGRRVFGGDDITATMYKVLNELPPAPSSLNQAVPRALSEVVMRALEKDAAKRFPTGREMARAIDQAVECFDEQERSAWMEANFSDAISRTRAMLALSESQDEALLSRAAEEVKLNQSAPGSSSHASLEIPTSTVPGPPEVATRAARPAPRSATILIVDDSRVGRMAVESVLKADGHRVLEAQSGEEAMEVLEQMRPDLIVLDVRMPGMDGFELCGHVRARADLRRLPIVFLSAACSIEERSKGLQAGGDDFLRKPFEPEELVARVRVHLQRAAMLQTDPGAKP